MKPLSIEELFHEALEQHRNEQVAGARRRYQQVLALHPSQTEALSLLPLTNHPARSIDAVWGERSIRLAPHNVMSRINHGCHLKAAGEPSRADREFRIAQVLDPTDTDGPYNEGVLREALGDLDPAIRCYRRALSVKPSSLLAQSNLGLCLLAIGEFSEGWTHYETRFSYDGFQAWNTYQFRYPQWDGLTNLRGRRIALWAEQGLGDALQFCRFASVLAKTGAVITIVAHVALHRILSSLPGIQSVSSEPPADQDFHFPLMSLPRVFGLTVQTIPFASQAYLSPDVADVAEWRGAIANTSAPRVGLVWRAGAISKISGRNLDIRALTDLSELGITFICLQKEVTTEEREFLQSSMNIVVLDREQRDFADTAAIIASLDLVISVDTSVAHLSGALGKETWVLLPKVCDWRWMIERADSPWYASVRLIRQRDQGDWSNAVKELRQMLLARYNSERYETP